jgi:hypothetical protein
MVRFKDKRGGYKRKDSTYRQLQTREMNNFRPPELTAHIYSITL